MKDLLALVGMLAIVVWLVEHASPTALRRKFSLGKPLPASIADDEELTGRISAPGRLIRRIERIAQRVGGPPTFMCGMREGLAIGDLVTELHASGYEIVARAADGSLSTIRLEKYRDDYAGDDRDGDAEDGS